MTNFVSKVIKSLLYASWVERNGTLPKIKTALTTFDVLNVSHRPTQ